MSNLKETLYNEAHKATFETYTKKAEEYYKNVLVDKLIKEAKKGETLYRLTDISDNEVFISRLRELLADDGLTLSLYNDCNISLGGTGYYYIDWSMP